jgi:hypothetical protein
LSRSGWNDWQTKFLIGKAIPVTDETYLQTLELEIRERYPKAYADYLNIKPERIEKVIDEETRRKAAAVEQLIKRVEELEKKLDGVM